MSTEAITQTLVETMTTPEQIGEAQAEATTESMTAGSDDFGQRLAILAKKEKALLAKQQSMAQKLKEMEEMNKKYSQFEELDRLAAENPNEYFKRKGLSFEKIQQKMLESLQDDELDPIQKQLKELQSKLSSKDEEYKKLLEEKLAERDAAKKNQEVEEQSKYYNQELKKFLASKQDEYDLINVFDAGDEVFNVIKQVYLKTAETGSPKMMTFEEASNLYEKKLEEMVQGMKKSKKVSKIFGASSEEDIFGRVSGQNTMDDSFSPSSAHSPELKTEEERLRAAAKLFEQQLKQL